MENEEEELVVEEWPHQPRGRESQSGQVREPQGADRQHQPQQDGEGHQQECEQQEFEEVGHVEQCKQLPVDEAQSEEGGEGEVHQQPSNSGVENEEVGKEDDEDDPQFVFTFDPEDDEENDDNANKDPESTAVSEWSSELPSQQTSWLKDTSASVIFASQHVIWLSISDTQYAYLLCGQHYVNNAFNVHHVCQSDLEMMRFFNSTLDVTIDAIETSTWPTWPPKLSQKHNINKDRITVYETTLLYMGKKRPSELMSIHNKASVARLEQLHKQVWNRQRRVHQTLLRRSRSRWSGLCNLSLRENWFTTKLELPKRLLKHPQDAQFKDRVAVVESLHAPHGGVLSVNNGDEEVHRVRFHRSRVFVDDHKRISCSDDITQVLALGSVLRIDYIASEKDRYHDDDEEELDDQFDTDENVKYTALLVCTSPTFRSKALASSNWEVLSKRPQRSVYTAPFYIGKIRSFDAPNEDTNYLESGTVEIMMNDYKTNLNCRSQVLKESQLLLESRLKLATFDRKDLYINGHSLAKADLARVFSATDFGLNTFYCQLEEVSESGSEMAKYRVKVGWKPFLQLLNPFDTATISSMWSDVDAMCQGEVLFMPRLMSWHICRLYKELLFNVQDLEAYLDGRMEALHNGNSHSTKWYVGRISNLDKSHADGLVNINMLGRLGNEVGHFKAEDVQVFGHSLKNASIIDFLKQNNVIEVQGDKDKGSYVKVLRARLGFDMAHVKDTEQDEANFHSNGRRHEFALFLDRCNLRDMQHFRHKLKTRKETEVSTDPERVPMHTEINEGVIVKMEDVISSGYKEMIRDLEKQLKTSKSRPEGIVTVERGALRGELIVFEKRHLWLFGQNMREARRDELAGKLKLLNEQVCVEAHRKEGQYYIASIVWIGKERPENEDDPNRQVRVSADHRDESCRVWLARRQLEVKHLLLVASGQRIRFDKESDEGRQRDDKESKKRDEVKDQRDKRHPTDDDSDCPSKRKRGEDSGEPSRRQIGQVLRNHSELADGLLSRALAVRGPDDLVAIGSVINNDKEAEVAFHALNSLDRALKHYRCVIAQQQRQQLMWSNNPTGGSFSLAMPLGEVRERRSEEHFGELPCPENGDIFKRRL